MCGAGAVAGAGAGICGGDEPQMLPRPPMPLNLQKKRKLLRPLLPLSNKLNKLTDRVP